MNWLVIGIKDDGSQETILFTDCSLTHVMYVVTEEIALKNSDQVRQIRVEAVNHVVPHHEVTR
jgi:hypothetical protein